MSLNSFLTQKQREVEDLSKRAHHVPAFILSGKLSMKLKEDKMVDRVVSVIFALYLFCSNANGKGNSDDYVQNGKTDTTWVALAVGSATEQLGTGRTLIFWGEGRREDVALYNALNKCTESAYNCFDLPPVNKRQFCKQASRGLRVVYGSSTLLDYIFLRSEMEIFQSICLRL